MTSTFPQRHGVKKDGSYPWFSSGKMQILILFELREVSLNYLSL